MDRSTDPDLDETADATGCHGSHEHVIRRACGHPGQAVRELAAIDALGAVAHRLVVPKGSR